MSAYDALRALDEELRPCDDRAIWDMARTVPLDDFAEHNDEDPLGLLTREQFKRWQALCREVRDLPRPDAAG